MNETSTASDNTKMFDSGYSNTCSNSQYQESISSSLSRESNQSESSGYCEGHASTSGASNEPLPAQPKTVEHKKKKKTKHLIDSAMAPNIVTSSTEVTNELFTVPSNPVLENKSEARAVVELVDATEPREHNKELIYELEAGLGSRTNPLDENNSQSNDDFYVLISMTDGLVVYTTISLEIPLGYSKNDLIGKSFVDFIRPEDKTIFLELVNGIAMYQNDCLGRMNEQQKASLICGMKRNNTGIVSDDNSQYKLEVSNVLLPFHLSLTFDKYRCQNQSSAEMFLVIYAQLVYSAYKESDEAIVSSVFTTRHAASCKLFYIDVDATKYLGYLPQDMIGRSVFDFYHPEDLSSIKEIYETLMKPGTKTFKSKPYRFIVQNGDSIVLETEWSRFVNPWTQKLEFVIGQHSVLKGPAHPDVFNLRTQQDAGCLENASQNILQRAKELQNDILIILNKNIQKSDQSTNDVVTRSKDFAPYMECLLQEMPIRDHLAVDDRSFSGSRNPLLQEHDSVMLGEISPHHEYYDSKSSTETPLSYNQLNYNENIERFFNSKPDAVMYNFGMDDQVDNPCSSNTKHGNDTNTSTGNTSGASGSAEYLSNGVNNPPFNVKDEKMMNYRFPLTEILINKHNEDMEKLMIQKHKELRSSIKNEKHKKSRVKTLNAKNAPANDCTTTQQCHHPHNNNNSSNNNSNNNDNNVNVNIKVNKKNDTECLGGVKRNRSCSYESVDSKVSKHKTGRKKLKSTNNTERESKILATQNHASVVPSNYVTSQLQLPRYVALSPMIPVYYIPVHQSQVSGDSEDASLKFNTCVKQQPMPFSAPFISCVPSIIYPSMLGHSVPITMINKPVQKTSMSQNTQPSIDRSNTNGSDMRNCNDNTNSCYLEERSTDGQANLADKVADTSFHQENKQEMCQVSSFVSSCIPLYCNENGASDQTVDDKNRHMDESDLSESNTSSFDSSFFTSSCSYNTDQNSQQSTNAAAHAKSEFIRKDPHWLEGVHMTPKLIYEYQVDSKSMNEVLQSDMKFLQNIKQPQLVNNQLDQLYKDLELEQFSTKLNLDDNTNVGEFKNSINLQASWIEEEL